MPPVPVYQPPTSAVAESQLTAFIGFCEQATGQRFMNAAAFQAFAVREYRLFWSLFLGWSGVAFEGPTDPVCTDERCERATFFPNVRLGYVENLLRGDPDRPALVAVDGAGQRTRLTRGALARRVYGLAGALEGLGVGPDDRVVAIADNDANAVIGGLAVAALGAALATSSPDMGAFSILSRFGQLQPRVLLCPLRDAAQIVEVARGLPSLTAIVALDESPVPAGLGVPVHRLDRLAAGAPIAPRRFPFNQPLFILFSSGTTGQPKCIVHGAGGTLLEHLKEHRLHGDLRPDDTLFFQTACSWMMWNWQLSALAVGAQLVLHSGPVRGPTTLWELAAAEQVTVFGTSPAYLQMCEDAGYAPPRLEKLRALLSTGSILYDPQYDWVGANLGAIPVQSISGGTDIIGCFVLGNPNLPIYRGESQCRSLALDVRAQDGELVCCNPFPSRPLGFLGDPGGKRFHDAYFKQNEGMWSHGDLIEFSAEGSARLNGRTDGVLNVRGIRVGPAELYRILHGMPGIAEALAVEQQLPNRLVLLIVVAAGFTLDGPMKRRIRHALSTRGSPAHVPELILAVQELPRTHSGKRSERAARDAVNSWAVENASAIANPASLEAIARAMKEQPAAPALSPHAALTAVWERVLDVAPIGPDDNFFSLGGTSLQAVRLFNLLREQTGRDLPPSLLYEAPTLSQLAAALEMTAVSPLVTLKSAAGQRRIFFVHGLAGDVLELRSLADQLRSEVLGLRALGPHTTVEQMAACYVEHVRRIQPAGPYALLGYSFGGLVAFEMGRLLRSSGAEVDFLGLLDTALDDGCLPPIARARYRGLRKLHHGIRRLGREVPALSRFLHLPKSALEHVLHANFTGPLVAPWQPNELPPWMERLEAMAWTAFHAYRPRRHDGPVTYFKASTRTCDFCDPIPLWDEVTGGRLRVVEVPGDHFSMIRDPWVSVLASRVSEHL